MASNRVEFNSKFSIVSVLYKRNDSQISTLYAQIWKLRQSHELYSLNGFKNLSEIRVYRYCLDFNQSITVGHEMKTLGTKVLIVYFRAFGNFGQRGFSSYDKYVLRTENVCRFSEFTEF
jgi:hypothetical protein